MKKWFFPILIVFAINIPLHSKEKKHTEFHLFSKSFHSAHFMPPKLAGLKIKNGENKSPSLYWQHIPESTQSFAIICIDTHPIAKRWIHWMIINIPPNISSIPQNASLSKMPKESVELLNSFGKKGWGGPQPPKNSGVHKYIFKIFALSKKIQNENIKNEKEFNNAIKKAGIIDKAICSGLFKKN